MKTYSRRTRKIGGKTFRHTGASHTAKSSAQNHARRLRQKGYHARVIRDRPGVYAAWRGPKKR